MKTKSLLPILLLAAFALGACTPSGQSSKDESKASEPAVSSEVQPTTSEDTTEYGVAIANKEALQAEWFVGDDRDVDVTLTPEINPLTELNKNLTVTSSNPEVVFVSGLGLNAIGAGSATITVTYHGKTDSVDVTTVSNDPRVRYGTTHEGTETDPFTNEDAILVAEATGTSATSKKFYVQGVVDGFKEAPSNYGNVSFYLTPAQAGGQKFLAYRLKLGEKGDSVTDEHIWVGGTATIYVSIVNYQSNTPESSAGWLVSCTGEKQTVQNHVVNVAEAIEACKALGANGSSDGKDTYEITGYIVAVSGADFFLSDTKGATEKNSATQFQVYAYNGENKDECTVNAKVKVECTIKYYKSTSSDAYAYETSTISKVTILEAGDAAPEVEKKTVAQAIELINGLQDNETTAGKYEIEGYIVAVTTAWNAGYKNLSYTLGAAADATDNLLTVFRSGAETGTDGSKLKAGDKVKVVGNLQKFVKDGTTTPEVTNSKTTLLEAAAGGDTPTIEKKTVAEAIAIINTLEDNKNSTEQYEVEGYIVAVTTAWNTQYNNLSYTLGAAADATENLITVFRSGAATGTDGSALKAGDKVKVVGNLQKFVKDGTTTPELTNGTTTLVPVSNLNYGTEAEPLTIAQAKLVAATLTEVNSYSESMLWVKAYVTNVPTVNGTYGWKNIYLGDAADAAQADCLLAFSVNKSDTCAKLAQNDFVVIHGALKNYSGTIEFTNVKDGDNTIHGYPTFSGRVAGTSTITLGAHENATVSELPATAANDTAINFTVTPATGYVISTVKVNNKAITGTDGAYSFELAGNSTIEVNVVAQGEGGSNEPQSGDYALFKNDMVEGDYVIYYNGKAVKATVSSNRLGYAELEPTNNFISAALAAKEIVWHISKSGDNWVIKNADANKYMASTGTKNQAALVDSITDKATWTITKKEDGSFEIENVSNKAAGVNSLLRNNNTYGFATYASSTGGTLSLYQKKA